MRGETPEWVRNEKGFRLALIFTITKYPFFVGYSVVVQDFHLFSVMLMLILPFNVLPKIDCYHNFKL